MLWCSPDEPKPALFNALIRLPATSQRIVSSTSVFHPCMQSTSLSVRVFRHLRYVSTSYSSSSVFKRRGNRSQPARSLNLRAVEQDALQLAPGQVDLWWLQPEKARTARCKHCCAARRCFTWPSHAVQVTDPGLLQRYMQLLTSQEQAYVREGSSEAVQKERLLARTLQRTTLARYLGCTPECPCLHTANANSIRPHLHCITQQLHGGCNKSCAY